MNANSGVNPAMIRNSESTLTTAHETVKPRNLRAGEDHKADIQMLSIVMMLRLARWGASVYVAVATCTRAACEALEWQSGARWFSITTNTCMNNGRL